MTFVCPGRPDVKAYLPRGRAWQTHEDFEATDSTINNVCEALADVFEYLNQRFCALRDEFWCATHVETHDLWLREYGLPDACDPYPDLCAKVTAKPGSRCEDYSLLAGQHGWAVSCTDVNNDCATQVGECFVVGCDITGGAIPASSIRLVVNLDESPSYVGAFETGPFAGALQAGLPLACEPDITPLKCILERVIQAHIEVVYEVVTND